MKPNLRSNPKSGMFANKSHFFFRVGAAAVGLFACSICQAANRYVRASGDVASNGDGSSWTSAYKGFPAASSLVRGDTYYIADGAYGGLTFNTAASGTTAITIRKATIASHGTDTGWLDSFGEGQATFSSQIQFTTRYWVFDGVVGGGPPLSGGGATSWKTGHGFKITETSSTPAIFINGGGNVDVSHVEIVGSVNAEGGTGNDAFQVFGGSGPNSISYSYLHDVGRCIFYHGGGSASPLTASYIYTGKYTYTTAEHSEWVVLRSTALFTVRWSIITHEEGTGGVIAGDDGQTTAEIYGNVFFADGTTTWATGNNGLIAAFSTGSAAVNWKVYNNTFVNIPSNLSIYGISGQSPSGNQIRNNCYYLSTSHSPGSGWTQSYDHFVNSGTATGTNSTTGSVVPFANYLGYDFRLTANTTPGTALGSPYDVDMYGNTRTTWTRGAVEFGNSPPTGAVIQITTP